MAAASRRKKIMPILNSRIFRGIALVVGPLVLVGVLAAMPFVGLPGPFPWGKRPQGETSPGSESTSSAVRVPGRPDTVQLPADVVETLRIQTATARQATEGRTIDMSGRLALDANRLARVHSRFAGEVVQVEQVPDTAHLGSQTELRALRPGDKVVENQLLAIVWSKDLGEKKSELMAAVSQLRLDRTALKNLEASYQKGAIPERSLLEAQQKVESSLIALDRARRTLRSWRLTEAEIKAIEQEAERLKPTPGKIDTTADKQWARVEVRAPFAGTIVEKNITLGDIVDTSTNLFIIADVNRLAVWADAYEEDLPALLRVPFQDLHWTIRLKADPAAGPLNGTIDYISEIIDPTQHTALVVGRINNAHGRLRAGQFVTATVVLPVAETEVEVPTTALIEDGRSSVLFVQEDPGQPRYTLRKVAVVRRRPDAVVLRARLSPSEERRGMQAVKPGERVVRSGAVELKKALEELQSAAAE
jgi:cobalt-zinc-cadmium efflux system membrane fusion protein